MSVNFVTSDANQKALVLPIVVENLSIKVILNTGGTFPQTPCWGGRNVPRNPCRKEAV